MARTAFAATVVRALGGGEFVVTSAPAQSVAICDPTATEAAVATLEADGASPTQAHVTALRSVWNTLKANITTVQGSNVLLDIDQAAVPNASTVQYALRNLMKTVNGSM